METVFPESDGVSGALLLGWRRRPGSGVSVDNIEQVMTVILKRAFTVDPVAGTLSPDPDGPVIFEGDQPANFLANGDFSDGTAGWVTTGGASVTAVEGGAAVARSGAAGDIRRNAAFGRHLRERTVRIVVDARADTGLAAEDPLLVQGADTSSDPEGPASFPASGDQPILLSNLLEIGAGASATSLSARLPTIADGESVTYSNAVVTTVEYEGDLVAYKSEADLIVIADAPPEPVRLSVDGTTRMSQEALPVPLLTGLGWEARTGTTREGQGGDFSALTQALPDDFQNLWYNGYRRDRRQGATVPFPGPGAVVEIERDGGDLYAFSLPAEVPQVRHEWFTGRGEDNPCLWRGRTLGMALDTLVVEPDRDRAYAVWRAVWPADFDPDGSGPIPADAHRKITVTLEGP
jgi:hypothetical protein